MGGDSDGEHDEVVAPSDPGAKHVPVVVPAKLADVRFASPQMAIKTTDALSNANQQDQSVETTSDVFQRQSPEDIPARPSTHWFTHNPKLYLLRYSEEHSLELAWERGTRGPEHGKEFFTTLRVPLPGILAEPITENAWARTKREAEGTAAMAACLKLFEMGLLEDPQEQKARRGPNAKRYKGVASQSERIAGPSTSSCGMRVRLSAAPLKMRTPHMKGLEECNHAHILPESVPVTLPTTLDNCLTELDHLDIPDISVQPQGRLVDNAFAEYYHANPTLSPTVDASQWLQAPDHTQQDDISMTKQHLQLPILSMKDQLIEYVRSSQIVLACGPSGSGKSTQLCQYVMDDWEAQGHGNQCSIVQCCSEGVVAESVSSHVAAERSTSLGTCVGFHTQSSHNIAPPGTDGARVTFTTFATLLNRLQYDPFLADVTHVILDGVDARTIQIDILLTYIRTLLPRRNSLRLILIAHDDNDCCRLCLQKYFTNLVCVKIAETSSAESVRACYLEDVLQLTQAGTSDAETLKTRLHSLDSETEVDLSLVTAVVAHIVSSSVDGGILVFMPSAEMVVAVCKLLCSAAPYSDSSRFCILPLDATGSVDTMRDLYRPVDLRVRKIVIATSVAEHEVPVDGIKYVVDTGRTLERKHVTQTSMTFFGVTFATRAACQRRRATAARGRDGYYFCLLSADRASQLQLQQEPEMKRMPLTEAILLIQNLELGNIKQFLSLTPDPPTPHAVGESLLRLHAIGALARETDELTPLGHQLAQISFVHPCIGKLLVLGALFDVRDDVLTIAAALCVKPILVLPEEERTQAATIHRNLSNESFSDHYTVLCAYNSWSKARQESGHAATEYASTHFVSETNLQALHSIRPMLAKALAATGLAALPAAKAARHKESISTSHQMGPLLRAAVTSSLMSTTLRVTQRSGGHTGYCTNDNCEILLHPSSVNATRACSDLRSPWLVFSSPMQHQSHLFVRQTTAANVAAMLVLSHGETWERVDTPMGAEIVIGDWMRFVCPVVGTFGRLHALRKHLGVALAKVLSNPEVAASCEYVDRVSDIALHFLLTNEI